MIKITQIAAAAAIHTSAVVARLLLSQSNFKYDHWARLCGTKRNQVANDQTRLKRRRQFKPDTL